jgi:NAD(P)-dependent dehydrogenase (short-subunit alcohol dehydrogenase family)
MNALSLREIVMAGLFDVSKETILVTGASQGLGRRAGVVGACWATPAGEKPTKRIPQRRVGAESDLDGAILLLASNASRYMTGSVVTVDGGFLLN